MSRDNLRPIERVILRLREQGMEAPQIGRRIGKKPGTVNRILEMIEHKEGLDLRPAASGEGPNALERTIYRLRAQGESYGEIGNRLGRSGQNVRRIERMNASANS